MISLNKGRLTARGISLTNENIPRRNMKAIRIPVVDSMSSASFVYVLMACKEIAKEILHSL